MSVDIRSSERKRFMDGIQGSEKDIAAGLLKVSQSTSTKALQETEKRIRREIANSNERRRMQCINAGFSNLRASIPLSEGEKLSKAAILQHATEYIASMEKDKTRLQIQLDRMKRMLLELGHDRAVAESFLACVPPPSKRKKRDTESSDEGVGSLSDASDDGGSDQQQENTSLRHQLEAERLRCATLEERNSLLETQLRTVLQAPPTQPLSASVDDVRVLSYDHLKKVPHYTRDVAESVTLREPCITTLQASSDSFQHPKSMSPPAMEITASCVSLDTVVVKNHPEPSSQHGLTSEDVTSPAVKVENLPVKLTTSLTLNEGSSELAAPLSNSPSPAVAIPATTPDQQRYHSHSYNHRDHPRRRHRQQAQLEQQRLEEELRNQQEQNEITAAALSSFRPKHNTQNLHNLVEAIRQIEGDRVLDGEQRFSDDDDYKVSSEEHERNVGVIDEHDRHSQSRDSSSLHHHLQRHQSVITSQQASSSSSSYSDKYPIAAHLLHRPIHPSFYRPGVIVHKL